MTHTTRDRGVRTEKETETDPESNVSIKTAQDRIKLSSGRPTLTCGRENQATIARAHQHARTRVELINNESNLETAKVGVLKM